MPGNSRPDPCMNTLKESNHIVLSLSVKTFYLNYVNSLLFKLQANCKVHLKSKQLQAFIVTLLPVVKHQFPFESSRQ